MIIKAIFMPRDWAKSRIHAKNSVMISITNPGDNKVNHSIPEERILRLEFRDFKIPDPAAGTFTELQARKIKKFVSKWHSTPEKMDLLVHCRAGQSRSAAVAKWASEALDVELLAEPSNIGTGMANPLVYETLIQSKEISESQDESDDFVFPPARENESWLRRIFKNWTKKS